MMVIITSFKMYKGINRIRDGTAALLFHLLLVSIAVWDTSDAAGVVNPNLPFGDINFVVVSDVHSFVGGHPHEVDRNADFGDFLSFHQRLKQHCDDHQMDLWLLENGDWLHGTGLAMDGNATSLLPILKSIPWDVMNMGNHEAMYSAVVDDMKKSLLPAYPGKYVTSNVIWKETMEPYGERYLLLKGYNSTVLLFGFLYDMHSPSETIQVVRVQDAIQQDWFLDAITQTQYDAIVVMAHMDNEDSLTDTIYNRIRSNVDPKMPIQFITGHTHERRYSNKIKKDHYVRKMEPGGLFDTVGWVTIPKHSTATSRHVSGMGEEFQHEFLNTSKTVLHDRLGLAADEPLRTPQGEALSKMIQETETKLGLDQIVACPGKDYFRNVSIHAENSLWKLWREHVVPTQIFKKDLDRIMLVSKDIFRYDLRGSGRRDAMTLDDVVAIAPYMERVIYVGDVPDWMIRRMNNSLNTMSAHAMIPDFVLAGEVDTYQTVEKYELFTHELDLPAIVGKLEKYNYQDFVLKRTGSRDTLYWLDYVMAAFPCQGTDENEYKIIPYFYDPSELEEEDTDGVFSSEDEEGEEEHAAHEDTTEIDQSEWTLPPGDYVGYIPGQGETHKIPASHYENYEPPGEEEEKKPATPSHHNSAIKDKIARQRKRRKSIIKGFALFTATVLLLIPVIGGVMHLTGRWRDDDDVGVGIYDREEVRSLRRHRRRGHTDAPPYFKNSRPVGEIEIT
jgi:hypothetical protein